MGQYSHREMAMLRPIFSTERIRQWENLWFYHGNPSYGLMQQAAFLVAQSILQHEKPSRVKIYCGPGNNGGDGWLVAGYLSLHGVDARVCEVLPPSTRDAQLARQQALAYGVEIVTLQNSEESRQDVVVDALLGIGLTRIPSGVVAEAIHQINRSQSRIISVDVPSGVQADTGQVWDSTAVRADITLCLIAYKLGLLTGESVNYVGRVELLPLLPPQTEYMPLGHYVRNSPRLPSRARTSHKGSNGHVLIIGGDENMGGAVALTAEAAMRVGAGKVTVACAKKHHDMLMARLPVLMTASLSDQAAELDHVTEVLQQADTVAVGMGLGRNGWGQAVWRYLLPALVQTEAPVIIDADALYHLAHQPVSYNISQVDHWRLTPHPGEAAMLLGTSVAEVEANRLEAVKKLRQKYGGQWVLKGAGSLVLEDEQLMVCGLGNPGMATGGMGDVLSGMAAGLLGQFPDLGLIDIVSYHAAAGDLAAQSRGERGLTASDVIHFIPDVVN